MAEGVDLRCSIGAHVGGTAYFLSQRDSRFDAHAETACVDAAYSLVACGKLNGGDGVALGRGNYTCVRGQRRRRPRLHLSTLRIVKEQSMQLVSQHPFGAGGLHARMFRLDNGLKVILVRDPSAPVFAYQTWFAVGSRHEREGITGIAHLFEHLMFNQTEQPSAGRVRPAARDRRRRHQRRHLGRLDLLPRQPAARRSCSWRSSSRPIAWPT